MAPYYGCAIARGSDADKIGVSAVRLVLLVNQKNFRLLPFVIQCGNKGENLRHEKNLYYSITTKKQIVENPGFQV